MKAMASWSVHMVSPCTLKVRIPLRLKNVSFAPGPRLARRLRDAGRALKGQLVRDKPRTRAVVLGLVRLLVSLLARDLPPLPRRKLGLPLVKSRLMRPSYPFPVGLAGRLRPTGLDVFGPWSRLVSLGLKGRALGFIAVAHVKPLLRRAFCVSNMTTTPRHVPKGRC